MKMTIIEPEPMTPVLKIKDLFFGQLFKFKGAASPDHVAFKVDYDCKVQGYCMVVVFETLDSGVSNQSVSVVLSKAEVERFEGSITLSSEGVPDNV